MKRGVIINTVLAVLVAVFSFNLIATNTYAEDGGENNESSENAEAPKTSLTLMPVSKTLQISSDSTYDGTLNATNDGDKDISVEVYAAPYSYVYSESDDVYKLGFSNENSFTQISRWITIKDANGNYTARPSFTIPAKGTLSIDYRINTPGNIPAGGQYAVIFVQTMSGNVSASGIRTEASAGMIIYGHSTEGEINVSSEIRDMTIGQGTKTEDGTGTNNHFYGLAKVKNTGNIDFFARGELKVEPIIGFSAYKTDDNSGSTSIIPESERVVTDEWKETPDFGLFKVTWTVTAGDNTETTERLVFLINPIVAIITIIVLTIIVISVIIGVRKRKERRSRLAV